MANKKSKVFYYIMVFLESGPRYVTDIDYLSRSCHWEIGEKPVSFDSFDRAKDIMIGLCWNGHRSVVVALPFEEESNPYNYTEYHFEAVKGGVQDV